MCASRVRSPTSWSPTVDNIIACGPSSLRSLITHLLSHHREEVRGCLIQHHAAAISTALVHGAVTPHPVYLLDEVYCFPVLIENFCQPEGILSYNKCASGVTGGLRVSESWRAQAFRGCLQPGYNNTYCVIIPSFPWTYSLASR